MKMENQPFEDVSPVENGDFPFFSWGGGVKYVTPKSSKVCSNGCVEKCSNHGY